MVSSTLIQALQAGRDSAQDTAERPIQRGQEPFPTPTIVDADAWVRRTRLLAEVSAARAGAFGRPPFSTSSVADVPVSRFGPAG